MKRLVKTILCAGAGIAMLISCEKEYPYQKVTQVCDPASVSLQIEGVDEVIGLMAPKTKSYPISIKASSIADDMLKFIIAVDPNKVDAYNAANGTDYELVPGDAYEFSKTEFILPRYNTVSSTARVTLKAAGLPDDGQTRLLPVTITKVEGTPETIMGTQDSTVFIRVYRVSLADMRFEVGSGTEADPYIIKDHADMLAMHNDLKADAPTYIKMEADVDMSAVEEWMPVNAAEPYKTIHFDGNGHTIKNLYSNAAVRPGLFGALTGSIKNTTFENCTIEPGVDATGTGLIAGHAVNAEISNVTIKGLTVNSLGNNNNGKHLGGLVGIIEGCKLENINIEVDVVDYDANGTIPRVVGGLVGLVDGDPSEINDCHVKGNIRAHHYGGGLIGVIKTENQKISNCTAEVNVTGLAKEGNYNAGFIGYANKGLVVTDCYATGKLDQQAKNYAGGFIGACQGNATIQRCGSEVDVTNKVGTHVGAFIGNIGVKCGDWNDNSIYGDSLVEDCYCTGDMTVTAGSGSSGRMNSGFIAMVENITNVTIRRCYAAGNVDIPGANGPCGGLLAMAKSGTVTDDIGFTMEHCIAWNKKIFSTPSNATTWSSGAIIGVSNTKNTLTDNYRRADMEYTEYFGDTVWKPFDQENTSPTSPLAWTNTNALKNKLAYHGKAAPADATCSSVAKSLGWSEEVWDLSGDLPKLK